MHTVIYRVGQNHTFIGIYGVHTVLLAGKSPYIRSYTVQIYGSGQPYTCSSFSHTSSIKTPACDVVGVPQTSFICFCHTFFHRHANP
jgi:hypothetical protein